MNRSARHWGLLALGFAAACDPSHVQGGDVDETDPPTMTILGGGMNTRGTGMYDEVLDLGPQGRVYRIEIVRAGQARRGIGNYIGDGPSLSNSKGRPGESVLRVSGADDPRLRSFAKEIAAQKHATVMVDMDITMGRGWADQTGRFAEVVGLVAEERLSRNAGSVNTILTHSAATVALSRVEALERASGKSYFSRKIAASPMTKDLSKSVLIVQSGRDVGSTDKGDLVGALGTGAGATTRDPEAWVARGNTVLRIDRTGFDPPGTVGSLGGHSETHALRNVDRSITVFMPGGEEQGKPGEPPTPFYVKSFTVPNVSPSKVLQAIAGRAGPYQRATGSRQTDFDRLKQEVERLQPPRGGGGIALKAAAQVDVPDAAGISWDPNASRLVVRTSRGEAWLLPPIDSRILAEAHACVFGNTPIDPEFSLGVSPTGGPPEQAADGHWAAYYVGPIDRSLFGLVLLRADVALGSLTFGGPADLRPFSLESSTEFFTLAQLFPMKYCEHADQDRFAGTGERVVLEALPTRLVRTAQGSLGYVKGPEFRVRFGRTTPVERAFSDSFLGSYDLLLSHVPELRDLVECSRAVGILKWASARGFALTAGAIASARADDVFTPRQVAVRRPPRLSDIRPSLPSSEYGPFGPVRLRDGAGLMDVAITYRDGEIHEIRQEGGGSLLVHADDLGVPIALEVEGVGAAGFIAQLPGAFAFYEDVDLVREGDRVTGFVPKPGIDARLLADPREIVDRAATRFLEDQTDRARRVSIARIATGWRFVASPDYAHAAATVGSSEETLHLDGRPLGPPYERISSITFSPDAKSAAWVGKRGTKCAVVRDGVPGKPYDDIETSSLVMTRAGLVYSPDGRRLLYVARDGLKRHVVVDEVKGPAHDGIPLGSLPRFSPDSSRHAYVARDGRRTVLYVDHRQQGTYASAAGSDLFSPDGRLCHWAKRGDKWVSVIDGVESAEFDQPDPFATHHFSPDGHHVVICGTRAGRAVLVKDGSELPHAQGASEPTWSPDSRRLAYVVGRGPFTVVLDGQPVGRTWDRVERLAFSPDSRRISYVASSGDRSRVVWDGLAGPEFDAIRRVHVKSDSTGTVYEAEEGSHVLVVDGESRSPAYDEVRGLAVAPNGRELAYAARVGASWRVVHGPREFGPYDSVFSQSLVFGPDSRHLCFYAVRGKDRIVLLDGAPWLGFDRFCDTHDDHFQLFSAADGAYARPVFLSADRIQGLGIRSGELRRFVIEVPQPRD